MTRFPDGARVVVIGGILAAVAFATWPAASFAGAAESSGSASSGTAFSGTASSGTALSGIGTADVAPVHFELRTSIPKADSTVAPTDEVRLWFTQEPQEGTTQIRVMRGDERVPTGDAQMDPDDATSYFVQHDMPLSAGEYLVMWRSMAPDGHVVSGDFEFRVAEADVGAGVGPAGAGR